VVREGDNFVWKGLDEKPDHTVSNPFDAEDRPIIGVYCYAYTSDGHYLAGKMSKKEIEQIRQTSKAKNSPAWRDWYGEMAKKSIIKRESKLWPKAAREMVGQAIQVLNDSEGLQTVGEYEAEQHYAEVKRLSEVENDQPEVDKDSPEVDKDQPIEGEFEEVKDTQPARTQGMSASTQHIIQKKMAAMQIGDEDFFKGMGIKSWDDLSQSDAAGCMDWISSQGSTG
jgi:recombinational DNA repair protein RecT